MVITSEDCTGSELLNGDINKLPPLFTVTPNIFELIERRNLPSMVGYSVCRTVTSTTEKTSRNRDFKESLSAFPEIVSFGSFPSSTSGSNSYFADSNELACIINRTYCGLQIS